MKPQIWGKINKGASMIQKPISQFKRKKSYSLDWESGAKKLLRSLCPGEETSLPTAYHCKSSERVCSLCIPYNYI